MGGICTLDVTLSTGVASITVQGTKYTTSTVLQFPICTEITWSAAAATGYTVSPTGNQKMKLTEKSMQIKPVATIIQYDLTITVAEGDQSITVTIDGKSTTYTKSTTLQVNYGASVSWTAVLKSDYTGTTSGSFTMTRNMVIYTDSYTCEIIVNANTFGASTLGNYQSYPTATLPVHVRNEEWTFGFWVNDAYSTRRYNLMIECTNGGLYATMEAQYFADVNIGSVTFYGTNIAKLYNIPKITVKLINFGSQGTVYTHTLTP